MALSPLSSVSEFSLKRAKLAVELFICAYTYGCGDALKHIL